jgi:hypothetical protein
MFSRRWFITLVVFAALPVLGQFKPTIQSVDTNGTIRSTAQTVPTSLPGLEMEYNQGGSCGYIRAYDRTNHLYLDLYLNDAVHISRTGDISTAGTISGLIYQDVAEWVPAEGTVSPATVVVVDPERVNGVRPSDHAYDTSVAGVVSEHPGLLLGAASDSKAKVATTGRVRVRVDATCEPIRAGDLLVTSEVPGTAMRSDPVMIGGVSIHRPGTIIGKALEPLASGEGEILVLLTLQ